MQNIIQQASAFRKAKEFQKAINIYQRLWNENPFQFNEWDGWSYAFCLKEMKMYHQALEICRQLYPRFKNSGFIGNLYAQCIYYSQLKIDPLPSLEIQKKAVRAMIRLSPPHQEYSLSGLAVFHLCKELMSLQPAPWTEIEEWLNTMEPDLLSQKAYRYELADGKMTEIASQQEQWYSAMVRVRAGLNQPEELLKLLDEAKKRNIRWHYQNDIWFERKKAFALVQLNQKKEAENILSELLKKKSDWFLYSDMGDVVADDKEKMKYYSTAAVARGKLEMKITLFEKIGNLLSKDNIFKTDYRNHLLLLARIRLENGWPFPPEHEKKLESENINPNAANSANEVFKQLMPVWEKFSIPSRNRLTGIIDILHENGKSGLIKCDDGRKYFIGLSQFKGSTKNIKPGLSVTFTLKDSFDKKRNKPSKMAVGVERV